mmetsp:Transcript_138321/g.430052  ORF Transcript_138321/g.430052 Transcript_138321/m.430052 type:complete len:378 (-) Transcript_138321:111-1244(-)
MSARGAMADEYASMGSDGEVAVVEEFALDSGRVLSKVEVRYMSWGELSEGRDNAIVICHALTGNANARSWWGELIGPGKPLDTRRFCVFCSNVLGSCYGTTGPTAVDPSTGQRYGGSFPKVTIRDMVRLQAEVLRQLGIQEVACAIGGSMGGMQSLEWALEVQAPRVRSIATLCASGRHHPWQIGMSECQRQAIKADPLWRGGDYPADAVPNGGLAVARMMAMLTYRTHPAYWTKFGRGMVQPQQQRIFDVENYLRQQGSKFVARGFDPMSYVVLTEAMDSHDVERGRGSYADVLRSISVPVLIVSISSDVLYPLSEQLELAEHIPAAQHHLIQSDEGHDGFLLEHRKVGTLLRGFLAQVAPAAPGNGVRPAGPSKL